MKLKKYVKHLNELLEEYPNADVVYASDSEGNSFHLVGFVPGVGRFQDGDFRPIDDLEDGEKPNAICLN